MRAVCCCAGGLLLLWGDGLKGRGRGCKPKLVSQSLKCCCAVVKGRHGIGAVRATAVLQEAPPLSAVCSETCPLTLP